jgi:HlyD family secretion protein
MKFKIAASISIVILAITIIYLFFFFIHRNERKEHLTLFGNVDIRQVDLGFRVYGKVQSLYFDEGDVVKTGQLLAQLDNIPYLEQKELAEAKVRELESSLKKVQAKFQKRDLTDPDAISKEDYDDAFYSLEEVKANLDQAKAALAESLTNLEDTKLLCPTNGVILTRIREPGSVLIQGEPVFTVSEDSPVWVRAYVSEPDLGKIYFGMPAKITTDTKGLISFKGHIGFISPVAEFTPKTVESLDLRTDLVYRIRVFVDDPQKELKQGMPVTVKLKLDAEGDERWKKN